MLKRFLLSVIMFSGIIITMSAAASAAKPTKLTFANWLPPHSPVSKGFEDWGAELEAKTNGRYVVELHHGGVLAGIPQAYDVVVSGLADISDCVTMDVNKPFPLTNIPSLPFYNAPAVAYTKAWYYNVYKKGYLDNEFKDVEILFQFSGMGEDFLTRKPLSWIDDLKGMKVVMGGGPTKSKLVKAFGGVGVFGGPPDAYMMLQKGIVDSVFISGLGLKEFHWDEFIKYIISPLSVSTAIHSVLMNKDIYKKLPGDVKTIIEELNAEARTSIKLAGAFDEIYKTAIKTFLAEGGKKITWSPDEIEKLNEMAKPLWIEWINKHEAKGIPARKVVNAFYEGLQAQGIADPALGYKPTP